MNIRIIITAIVLVVTSLSAAPDISFAGEVQSIEFYTTDINQGIGYSRDSDTKVEVKLHDQWVFVTVTWKSKDTAEKKSEYIVPREKILRITVRDDATAIK